MHINIITVSVNDYKYLLVTVISTFVFCWLLQEIFERKLGLSPIIWKSSNYHANCAECCIKKRMTRRLDIYDRYRITARGSVVFIKSIWEFLEFLGITYLFVKDNNVFFNAHFINLDSTSVNNQMLLHLTASGGAFFLWEIIADRYGKLKWPVLAHHFMTTFAATYIILGNYNPFASWYAYTAVAMSFPMNFALGFRLTKSVQYPIFTRALFKFIYCYFAFTMSLNFSGQIYLMVNGRIKKEIEIYSIAIMVIVCCIWGYDDYLLLKALKSFSQFEYESIHVLTGDFSDDMYCTNHLNINPQIIFNVDKNNHMNIELAKYNNSLTTSKTESSPITCEFPETVANASQTKTDYNKNSIISKQKSEKYVLFARIGKLVICSLIIVVSSLTIIFAQNVYKSIVLLNSVYNALWVGSILFVITYAKQLHYIQVDMIGIYGYRAFSVPNNFKANINKCIKSISDITGLPGASTHLLFLVGNCMTYILVLIAIIIKKNELRVKDDQSNISLYLFFVSDVGMLMVAIWNLEDNKLCKIMHYFGASCVFFLCSVAFMVNQNKSLLSIMLLIIQFITAIFYLVFSFCTPNQMEDTKKVHRISYLCILSELSTCAVSMFIANLYLFCMDGDIIL